MNACSEHLLDQRASEKRHRSACSKTGVSKQPISMRFSPMIPSGTCSSGSVNPSRRWRAGMQGDEAPLHRTAGPISVSNRTRMACSLSPNDSEVAMDHGGRCGADSPSRRRCIPARRSFCTRRCRTICLSSSHLPGLRTTGKVKRSRRRRIFIRIWYVYWPIGVDTPYTGSVPSAELYPPRRSIK